MIGSCCRDRPIIDIDPNTLNLDPKRIEAAITPRTIAIMPVHVYCRHPSVHLRQDQRGNRLREVAF